VRASAQHPEGRWSERGAAYAVSREHVAGPSLPKLLALADPRPGDRCLDVGTGAGHTAACLARAGAEVVALDPADGMLDAARRRYGALPGLRFVEAPGDATGLQDDAFDLVTARHTLHHHADPNATLREIARVLRPGGRFVLVDEITPDPRVDAWLDAVSRARDATHVRAYTLDEWRAMLATAGLRWVVGDTDTRYRMEVDAWIGRMDLPETEQAEVRRLFREAGPLERRLFTIEYEAGEAVRFALPMAVVLTTRPAEGETS
jgi:SAM-dependent methyltransferase